jgi:hypothetical protein
VHPRDVHQAQLTARAAQATKDFQARYALRAGVEGTIHQGVAVTGIRHARYRGLTRTRLEHANAAVAVNLIRLHSWWNGHPLDRTLYRVKTWRRAVEQGFCWSVQAARRYSLITPPRTRWRRIGALSGITVAGSWVGGCWPRL